MTRLLQVSMLAVCALVLAIGAPAMGAMITTSDGVGGDAFIAQYGGSGGGSNHNESGTSTWLFVKNTYTYERSVDLHFDLSTMSSDAVSAGLEVMIGYGGLYPMTVDVWGVNDDEDLDGWDETTITWNNAPANDTVEGWDGGLGVVAGQATYLGSYTHSTATNIGDLVTLVSGSALVDFLNDDTDDQVTIAIFGDRGVVGNYNAAYMGSDNTDVSGGTTGITHSPTLNISEVPEPSALVLLTAGLIGLVCYAWRKRK